MKRLLLFPALLIILSMTSNAQTGIDMRLVEQALHPQQARSLRNDIAPAKAMYYTNEEAIVRYRDMFQYDENEYYLSEIRTYFEDLGEWLPYAITSYEYDYNLMPVQILKQKYDNSFLVNDELITLSYSGNDFEPQLEEELFQTWENGQWVNVRKNVYSYEPDITILVRDWTGTNFNNHYLYTIENNGLKTNILLQYWNGGAWMNQEMQEITYNHSHEIQEQVIMEWDSPSWINAERHLYEYDGPYKLTKLTKTLWENGNWSPNKVKTINYTHDYCNSITAICEANYGSGEEQNTDIEMFYNEGNSITYQHIHEISMEYVDVTTVADHPSANHFTVAPNPAKDVIYISGKQFVKAEIYTLSGQKVLESTEPVIRLQGLSSGAYLLKIQDQESRMEIQKVLVK